jgi:hypothetical protein
MKSWSAWFNIYFLVIVVGLGSACQTAKSKEEKKKDKDASTMRLFLEVNSDGGERTTNVTIVRANPVAITVSKGPFLTEGDLDQANMVDALGIPSIRLRFKWPDGVRMLEMVTGSYKGQRIAVFSQFGPGVERWLAAPLITKQISDGIFVFTPDASREETERIVRGLSNAIRELKKKA